MSDENLDNITADTESQPVAEPAPKPKSLMDILNQKDEVKADAEDTDEQSTDDKPSEDVGESDEEPEETEEIEEEPEAEEEPVEEEEDQELTASFSGLKKKYPDIFKNFPGLRNKLGREYAYSNLFPTVDEAKAASQKSEVFDIYEAEIRAGNPDAFIAALPNMDTASKFAEQILPALRKAHPDLLTKAVDPFVRMMLNKVNKDAEASDDKNLGLAAKYISRYLYGKAEIPDLPTSRRNSEPDPEKELLRQQVQQSQAREVGNFETSVTNAVTKTLDKEIGLLLDPKNALTPKLKEVLTKQIREELDEELTASPTHMAKMKAFRERALKSGLLPAHKNQILSAYLANARPVLRTISQRVKSEALGKKNESKALETQDKGRKVIPSSSGRGLTKQPSMSQKFSSKTEIQQFKAKGGQMEDILGG